MLIINSRFSLPNFTNLHIAGCDLSRQDGFQRWLWGITQAEDEGAQTCERQEQAHQRNHAAAGHARGAVGAQPDQQRVAREAARSGSLWGYCPLETSNQFTEGSEKVQGTKHLYKLNCSFVCLFFYQSVKWCVVFILWDVNFVQLQIRAERYLTAEQKEEEERRKLEEERRLAAQVCCHKTKKICFCFLVFTC